MEFKIVNTLSSNKELDREILKKMFSIRMVNLENINIEFLDDNEVIFYDVETIEKKFVIENKGTKLRYNKKIKLFD